MRNAIISGMLILVMLMLSACNFSIIDWLDSFDQGVTVSMLSTSGVEFDVEHISFCQECGFVGDGQHVIDSTAVRIVGICEGHITADIQIVYDAYLDMFGIKYSADDIRMMSAQEWQDSQYQHLSSSLNLVQQFNSQGDGWGSFAVANGFNPVTGFVFTDGEWNYHNRHDFIAVAQGDRWAILDRVGGFVTTFSNSFEHIIIIDNDRAFGREAAFFWDGYPYPLESEGGYVIICLRNSWVNNEVYNWNWGEIANVD